MTKKKNNKKTFPDRAIEQKESMPVVNRATTKVSALLTRKYDVNSIQEYANIKTQKPILYVRNLSKKYFGKKQAAVNNISFDVYPGEFHAFIGANGAGKTTTIKCLIGAYANWSGTVLVGGQKNNKESAKRKLGYIPENARFPDRFSALKYLEWMTMLSGLSRKQAKEFSINKLKSLKMWSLRKKSPNSFSSGQKKKILLAQALIHNPDIIIMDEPVANLDPKARMEFFDLLASLRKKGKAIFVSSHVLAELDRYADSATILDGGNIVYSGDKKTLMGMFPTHNYRIKTSNDKMLETYLRKQGIKFMTKEEEEEGITAIFNDEEVVKKFQRFLSKVGLVLHTFIKKEPSLDQVYAKLVIKGSVDTQKG
ncbi:MAG: ABC transporter ATP-binding protein [Mycoplasmataceae bacterium]|nr:ABC transporter ATP-binding protein [Mycoplasmataceae bacterium]